MATTLRSRSTAIAVAAALVLTPLLGGCSVIAGIVNQASDGKINVSAGELPADWPTAVPVISGEVLVGGKVLDDDGKPAWNATIKVESEAAFADIQVQLEGAGFTQVDAGELDGGDTITSGAFKNDTYGVIVAVTGADGKFVANYTVVEGEPTS